MVNNLNLSKIFDNVVDIKKDNFIFELNNSEDGKYFIMNDEVFNIKEQKHLGNIWSSPSIINEITSEELITENNILLEIKNILSNKENYTFLFNNRNKLLLEEINNDNTSKTLKLLRKLKDAVYSNAGIVVDAILVATGIGKSVQWIPWAMITALDAYQLLTNKWPDEEKNDSLFWKILSFGFDAMALVTTGSAAKLGRKIFSGIKSVSPTAAKKIIQGSKQMKKFLGVMKKSLSGVLGFFDKAIKYLLTVFKPFANFLKKLYSPIRKFLGKLEQMIESLLSKKINKETAKKIASTTKKGVEAGTVVGVPLAIMDKPSDKDEPNIQYRGKPTFNYDDI